MTTKERAYLKGLAMDITPVLSLGKQSLTPEFTQAVEEAITKRELIKINVLKNCTEDPRALAEMLGERTHSEVVQVIGRKIVLFRENSENPVILLPGRKISAVRAVESVKSTGREEKTEGKTGAGAKPAAGAKPGAGRKPAAGAKPGAGKKPAAGTKSGAGKKPAAGTKSGMGRKPETGKNKRTGR